MFGFEIFVFLFLGEVFEKAGVNISVVWGTMNPEQVKTMRTRGKDIEEGNNKFFATGWFCFFLSNFLLSYPIRYKAFME